MTKKPEHCTVGWSLLCWLQLAASLLAQPRDIRFDHLSVEQGLSNFSINDIVQDRQGFLWFATEDGLNKYDGYEFKVYKFDPADTNSLPGSYISWLYLDREGKLWITAGGRLCQYDPNADKFVQFERLSRHGTSLAGKVVNRVLEDSEGTLWIGTDTGAFRYDRQPDALAHYRYNPKDPTSFYGDNVTAFCEDRTGALWMGTSEGGLTRYDRGKQAFIHYRREANNSSGLSSNYIFCLREDRRGTVWIGTDKGLCRYDRQTDQVVPWRSAFGFSLDVEKDVIFAIAEDSQGTLWVGTFHAGLWRYEPETDHFVSYRHDPADPYSLLDNRVHAIYEDRSGVMWLGHYRSGLSRYVRRQDQFSRYKISDGVYAVCQDRHGHLWIGADNTGLRHYDRDGKLVAHFRHDPGNPESLSNDQVLAILEDRQGDLWIGAGDGSVNLYDRQHRRFLRFRHEPASLAKGSFVRAKTIFEDSAGDIWIGTEAGGLGRLDRQRKIYTLYRQPPVAPNLFGFSPNNIWRIVEAKNGCLWLGTFGAGLYRFDKKTQQFTGYQPDAKNPESLSHAAIYSLYLDQDEYLWIGTFGGGLNRFDPRTERFSHYTDRDGLADNFVKGILPDAHGNLWLSTDKGLSRFDPRTKTFKNYTVKDGLVTNVLLSGAYHKNRDGRMFFGGEGGVVAFHPDSIRDNPRIPPVVITRFKVFDKPLPRSVPQQSHFHNDETPAFIRLSYRHNFFSFEFVALDYTAPEKNQFAYKLEGIDPEWVHAGTRRYANYTNVEPGDYVFRMKGSNNDGVWNEAGVSVNIIIMPPFWKTWWFRTSVILSVILALHTWHHRRTRALEEKKQALELQVKERTAFAEALQHALTEVESLKNRLEAENTYLQNEIKVEHNFADIISRSEALKKILRKVEQVAATDATVLILGESGTGKELLARAVHNLSARRERPLVKVNCAVLPATLIESELFGHEKGAFTGAISRKIGRFELADHGTIFLDEIGELPLELQAKLLRILQGGEFERLGGQQTLKVDTRVIAATNRDLKEEIARNRFREDLYYRLHVFPITIPPLRERKEDIPLLVNHFMKRFSAKTGKKIETVSQHVIETLQTYDWPGNVRELENVVERAVIVSQGKQLKLDDWLPHGDGKAVEPAIFTLEELERNHIIKVLEQTGWRISGARGAAKMLNINASTLRSRMEKLGIKK